MPQHPVPRHPTAPRPLLFLALALGTGLLAGCASLRAGFNELGKHREASEPYESVDRHSRYPAMRRREFEQVNLLELVDPHRRAPRAATPTNPSTAAAATIWRWTWPRPSCACCWPKPPRCASRPARN